MEKVKSNFFTFKNFLSALRLVGEKKNERDLRKARSARMDGKALFVFLVK
jgi:hypothetical protein